MKLIHSISFHQPETPAFCITLTEDRNDGHAPYATHWHNLDDGGSYDGRYFANVEEARRSFAERTTKAMEDTIACGGKFGGEIPVRSRPAVLLAKAKADNDTLRAKNDDLQERLDHAIYRLRHSISTLELD